MTLYGRRLLTLPRPGEQRKDTCAAASGNARFMSVQGVEVASIPPVKAEVPEPIPGLMDNPPAVVRRPFPVPCVGQMETYFQ